MLATVAKLIGNVVEAMDGDVGRVEDLIFDDEKWQIRYLLLHTGGWLSEKRILVPVYSFRQPSENGPRFRLIARKNDLSSIPDNDMNNPQMLRVNELFSYSVTASGERIGRLQDMIIDDNFWDIHGLQIELENIFPGEQICVAPGLVSGIDDVRREVVIGVSRAQIQPNVTYDQLDFTKEIKIGKIIRGQDHRIKLTAK
jgi:sporulation protein YlmC with PRC-barrel domain